MLHIKDKFSLKTFCLILSAILLVSCSGGSHVPKGAFSGPVASAARKNQDIFSSETETEKEYLIGPGDTLNIFVYRHPELSQKIMVPPSGKITYPFIGDLQAGGETIFRLRDKIVAGLAKGFVPNPQVSVNIDNISGKRIYVLGEVRSPMVLYIKDKMYAIEAISRSGGFKLSANQSSVLLIRRLENNQLRMDVIDLESFFKGSDLSQNVRLRRDDILYVPPSFIANVDRFFTHLSTILRPIMPDLMQSIILGPRVRDALRGRGGLIQIE